MTESECKTGTDRMTRNDNGTWYCYDCKYIVILFDDDTHTEQDCKELT